MDKKKTWMYIAVGSILLSVISLLFPIIIYRSSRTGFTNGYNIFRLFNTGDFNRNVFYEYTGSFLRGMTESETGFWIIFLCLVGLVAIILSFVGIRLMNKQYESAMPFKLAICGLIGTAIPSLVLLILFFVSKNRYTGTMYLGPYIIITPIAMIAACLTVTSKYRLNREEAQAQAEARAYIKPAGDLPSVRYRGGFQNNGQ